MVDVLTILVRKELQKDCRKFRYRLQMHWQFR